MLAVNTVGPILPEVAGHKFALLFRGLWIIFWWWVCGPDWLLFFPLYVATREDEGIIAHVHWGKGFTVQVLNPVTGLIVIRRA